MAALAEEFAEVFGAGDWGRALGLCHDLGKLSDAFQDYLRRSNGDPDAAEELTSGTSAAPGRVDHSTFGARYIYELLGKKLAGQIMAGCAAGHHAGLADFTPANERGTLGIRLDPALTTIPTVHMPADSQPLPAMKFPFKPDTANPARAGFQLAFFARMLFSCLIDADRIATEEFCDPIQAAERDVARPTLADLRAAVDAFMRNLQANATATPVNEIRARVLQECITASSGRPGFYSLNVPTGGGKTFASLAFALHHAAAHPRMRRVVVAIPFTSIIDQTAQVYRGALGDLADAGLVEHHSNLNPKRDTRQNKLATENWAAPLVVTTNVQLLESLFACKTTPTRKLHRLANSVIILDEAQTLPVDLLAPTLAALRELVDHYGCTVVLCTATQPALEYRANDFEIGLQDVQPIIANVNALHVELNRVTVERLGRLDDSSLADRIATEQQVLVIVNTKAHAAALYEEMRKRLGTDEGCFHLSTFMCAQHRRDILTKIRDRLTDKLPCRVISTQLIEAGVDVDFPCVYRAQAGFDSIAQAAGRCNREGKLTNPDSTPALGRVFVFEAETKPPPGLLRSAAETAAEFKDRFANPLLPDAVLAYFKQFYWKQERGQQWDRNKVLTCFEYVHPGAPAGKFDPFKFRSAADGYKIIQEEQAPVVVPYGKGGLRLVEHLQAGLPIEYRHYKLIQQYSVGIRENALRKLHDNAAIVPHPDGVWYLPNAKNYSNQVGLLKDAVGLGAEGYVL